MIPTLARNVSGALGLRFSALGASAAARTAARALPQQRPRGFSSAANGGGVDVEAETSTINDAFVQAREDIADARDDAETVYFNESAALARHSVDEVLSRWNGLLGRLGDKERGELTRSMGLKMEQLKAELKELDDLHA